MEVHSVLPEERARDENGKPLPWGYRYLEYVRVLPWIPRLSTSC